MKKIDFGSFCELYGKTIRNKVLEYFLEMGSLDFAIGDMAKEIRVSKPKAYEVIKELEKEGFIKKTRIVAGAQLYVLNEKKDEVKQLQKDFKMCLKRIVEEYGEKPKYISSNPSVGAVSARSY